MKRSVQSLMLVVAVLMLFAVSVRAADINLSAAASLRDAVTELSDNFAKKNPGIKFLNNFAASGAL
ncbi:MAG TPA: hypothetical protein VLX12_01465, partial [Syntrophorhabdales bacterium]|nr:hypothetical protein [Syntrophorhabdales bacterium]